jgi:hypothetical protein
MDILNWLYLRKQQLIRTTANNADTDIVALGADVTFAKRDDLYKTYAMTLKDLSVAGDVANTGYYTVDLDVPVISVDVNTQKGVIEIIMDETNTNPLPAFGSSVSMIITNANMDFTDSDKIYMQYSVYYRPLGDDSFIPYVLSTGVTSGTNFEIFNASPALAGTAQFTGRFYLYYELYNF